jgi:hypothetical protein
MQENTLSGWAGWMQQMDRLLRGEATKLSSLKKGTIELPESGLTLVIFVLGLLYGGCMGTFALLNRPTGHAVLQLVSSMAKVPCLFFLTLIVTFPSLYVFNALVGSRLSLSSVWRLMIAMMAVMMAILASLGPIVAFFSLSTNNYGFMLMLNVIVFALSGFLVSSFCSTPAPTEPRPQRASAQARASTHFGVRGACAQVVCPASEPGSHWRAGSDGEQDARLGREDGFLLLDSGVRPGRDADELGLAPLHRESRRDRVCAAVAARVELLRRRVERAGAHDWWVKNKRAST